MSARTHESFVEHHEVELPSDRSFGLTVGGILVGIGAGVLLWSGTVGIVIGGLAGLGGFFVLAALVRPAVLRVPNRLWMKLGALLGMIVSPLVMLFVYVVAFLPIGLVLRLTGHKRFRRRLDRDQPTYWIDRPISQGTDSGMKNQF